MSAILRDEACPECRKKGRDRTGNHLIVFADGGRHCNRCGYTVKPNQEIEMPEELSIMKQEFRGVLPSTYKAYGVKAEFDEGTGDLEKLYYPYGKGYKVRKLPKEFYASGKMDGKLFGQGIVKSSILVITEGEQDAMAAFQMLKASNPVKFPAVVSLPNGASSPKAVSDNLDWIKAHAKVVLCFDNDKAGSEGLEKVAALLEGKVHTVSMELKDAAEYLESGKAAEFVEAVRSARRYSPEGIVTVADVMKDAMKKPEWGVPWPWETLNKATFGIREGEGYYIGAGVKVGKSEFLNELVKHLITLGKKPFVLKAEEIPSLTAKKIAGKLAGKLFHRPDIDFDMSELEGSLHKLEGNLFMYNRHNSLDWDAMKNAIRHAVVVEGSKHVFIDPITCLTDGLEASDANRMLQQFSREVDQMSKDLGFTYFVFCHLNAPTTGKSHENGGKVRSSQFTGSRAMMRACTYMIGIERDKDPELDEEERNTSHFVLLEDRMFGNNVRFPVFYNKETGDYLEPEGEF